MMAELFKYDNYNMSYNTSSILSDNNKIAITFYKEYNEVKKNSIIFYQIYLRIKHKRKNNVTLKQTGKCGLEGLIWAKNKIIEFEEYIKTIDKDKRKIILVGWDDNRRRNVYHKGLKNIGYKYGFMFDKKYLFKEIRSA